MDERLGRLEGKVDGLEKNVSRLEGKVDGLDARLGGLETSVARLEVRMDGVEKGLGKLEQSVDGLKTEISSFKKWVATTLVAIFALIIATLSLHTKWIYNDTNKNWQRSEELMKEIKDNQLRLERMDAERSTQK